MAYHGGLAQVLASPQAASPPIGIANPNAMAQMLMMLRARGLPVSAGAPNGGVQTPYAGLPPGLGGLGSLGTVLGR